MQPTKGTGAAFRAFAAAGTQRYIPDLVIIGTDGSRLWANEAATAAPDAFDALGAECAKFRFGKAHVTTGPLADVFGT